MQVPTLGSSNDLSVRALRATKVECRKSAAAKRTKVCIIIIITIINVPAAGSLTVCTLSHLIEIQQSARASLSL